MSRVVGIDLGRRRIGVAVSDGLGLTAQPHATLARHGGRRDMESIAAVVKAFDAERLVLGLPLDPEGTEGTAAKSARAFAARLVEALGLPVDMVDERYSTVEAEQILLQADLSREKRRRVIDRLAAAIILQRWLDGRQAKNRDDGGPLSFQMDDGNNEERR